MNSCPGQLQPHPCAGCRAGLSDLLPGFSIRGGAVPRGLLPCQHISAPPSFLLGFYGALLESSVIIQGKHSTEHVARLHKRLQRAGVFAQFSEAWITCRSGTVAWSGPPTVLPPILCKLLLPALQKYEGCPSKRFLQHLKLQWELLE